MEMKHISDMKIVGKRMPARGWKAGDVLQKLVISLRGDMPFIPRGVYRFDSFEKAQLWNLKMLTRSGNRGRRRSTI